jgi:hypothetical protein
MEHAIQQMSFFDVVCLLFFKISVAEQHPVKIPRPSVGVIFACKRVLVVTSFLHKLAHVLFLLTNGEAKESVMPLL